MLNASRPDTAASAEDCDVGASAGSVWLLEIFSSGVGSTTHEEGSLETESPGNYSKDFTSLLGQNEIEN